MPLGIEQNNIAPQLIQNSGAALVQGIRQIGQQISGHLTEIQTKRDLGALAQEMQGINVQSNDFPVQLTQMLSRHPLAARDERGQMALSILGKAHGQWQQQQIAEARINPYRSMAGGGIYNANTGEVKVEPTAAPKSVNRNARLVNPETGEVLVEPEALPEKGFNLPPGSTRYDAQGNVIAKADPKPETQTQRDAMALRKNAERRAIIKEQVDSVERDIRALEQSLRSESKMNVLPGEKVEWQKQVEKLRDQRNKLLESLNAPPTAEEITIEPELGAVPAGAAAPQGDVSAVLPAPGAVAVPLPDGNELVAVINPQGKPTRIKKSQLESALQNGYRTR